MSDAAQERDFHVWAEHVTQRAREAKRFDVAVDYVEFALRTAAGQTTDEALEALKP